MRQTVYIHRRDAESAERTIFCLSGDTDRQRTSDPSGLLQPKTAESSGESASPDSPEIIAFSATSLPAGRQVCLERAPNFSVRVGGEILYSLFLAPGNNLSRRMEVDMAELKVVHIKDVKGERREPPRVSWILVSEKTVGAQNLAMGVNETYPGGMVPEHKHDNEEEVMFFLAGRGTFVTEGREIPLEPGVCIYNPPGKLHKIINTGDEILRFVWIYSPQLPSHRK